MNNLVPWILMAVCIVIYEIYVTKKKSERKKKKESNEPIRECYITEGLYLGMTLGLGFGYLAGLTMWGIGGGMVVGLVLGLIVPKKKK
ncbi:MAG: hypothetical protein U0L05_07745 [Schaedlerella sp.]|nr:hypothetical protein [Schaedlerella sp.]